MNHVMTFTPPHSKLMVENIVRFSQLTDFSDFGWMDVGCLVGLPSLEVMLQTTRSCGTRPWLHAKRHPHGHLVNRRDIGKYMHVNAIKDFNQNLVWSCLARKFRPKTRCHSLQCTVSEKGCHSVTWFKGSFGKKGWVGRFKAFGH